MKRGTNQLLDEVVIRGVRLRNRIAVSPMCQYSAADGMANDWHLVHLGSRAAGGAGLVIVEATAVTPTGRITPGDLGLWSDDQIEPLARIARFIESMGAVPGIQIAHAGRKASCRPPWEGGNAIRSATEGGWPVVSASAIPFHADGLVPQSLSESEVHDVISAFGEAARRSSQAGYNVIELHAAHGYLIDQFLSPLSNKRTDSYGGSLANRMRFLLETVHAVRAVIPKETALFTRISATDWVDGGWTIDDSVVLGTALREAGVDLIDTSSGGVIPNVKIPAGLNYQVGLASEIRSRAGIMTGAVGVIVEPGQANEIISSGAADIVLIGREMLREPYWPLKAQTALGQEPAWPRQYGYAVRRKK